jgi:hypothetical protein
LSARCSLRLPLSARFGLAFSTAPLAPFSFSAVRDHPVPFASRLWAELPVPACPPSGAGDSRTAPTIRSVTGRVVISGLRCAAARPDTAGNAETMLGRQAESPRRGRAESPRRGRAESPRSAVLKAEPDRAQRAKMGVPATVRPNARTDSSSQGIASRTLPPLPAGRALDGPRLSTQGLNRAPGRGVHLPGLLAPLLARRNVLESLYLSTELRNSGPDARHILVVPASGTRC